MQEAEKAFILLLEIKKLGVIETEIKTNLRWMVCESAAPRKWLLFAKELYQKKYKVE